MESLQKVKEKGQVTIPKLLREALDIKIGDLVIIEVRKIEPKKDLEGEKATAET